jgi:outer membrane receptor for ferrienterochelin and colicin
MDLDTEDRLLQFRLMGENELLKGITLRTGLEFFKRQTFLAGMIFQDELDLSPSASIDTIKTGYISNRTAHFIEFDIVGPFGFNITPGLRIEVESISKSWIMDPRVALVIPISVHSNINAAYGFYRQYPDPQYYDSYVGNPDLSAMKAVHTIIGYAYQNENSIFRMEGYYKDYKNLLLEDLSQNYINSGNGFATGVDLFLKHSYGSVSGWVSYSRLKACRKWMDVPVSAPTHFDITNNLTTVFNLDLTKNFSLGFSYRYATGKPYTTAPEKFNKARVPDYQKVDVNVTYLCRFFKSNLTVLYFAISNALDRTNIFDYRYSNDYKRRVAVESPFGRSMYFGVSFSM